MSTRLRPQKVWVLYGGDSKERDVSIKTGQGVLAALLAKGFEAQGFDILPETLDALPWSERPDIVFVGLHGHFGEDGAIQGYLESKKIPYVGSGVLSSALSFHKGFTKSVLLHSGIPTPHYFDVNGEDHFFENERSGRLGEDFYERSWFIKPAQEGSTIGIERFRSELYAPDKKRQTFIEMLHSALKFCQDIVVEEWVDGPEVTVPVLHGEALASIEIRPKNKFYNYESKYTQGATEYLCPAPLEPEVLNQLAALAVRTFHVLKCQDYGRVDFIVGAQGPSVLEMNTLPGMTSTSLVPKSAAAEGMTYEDFVERLVCGSYQRQNKS
jgi:D-alanine-D-alanine ligase